MVAITNPASLTDPKLGPVLVSPPPHKADIGYATQAIKKGDPVMISGAAPNRKYPCSVANASGTDAVGICLKTVQAGGTCEYAMEGEFDGYVGMTPGARLSLVGGKLDNTVPSATVPVSHSIRAVNATRIRFVFV